MSKLHKIASDMELAYIYKLECATCWSDFEIEAETMEEAAKEAHRSGWRYADEIEGEDMVIEGTICPDCAQHVDWKQKQMVMPDV